MDGERTAEELVTGLLKLLAVRPDGEDRFTGRRKRGGVGRVFGGEVIAQALNAAEATGPVTITYSWRKQTTVMIGHNATAGLVHHRKVGIFQIMLRYPQFQGSGAARRYADLLEFHFRRATLLQESGLKVLVTHTPATGPAQKDGDRYCLPVSVRYQADVFQ